MRASFASPCNEGHLILGSNSGPLVDETTIESLDNPLVSLWNLRESSLLGQLNLGVSKNHVPYYRPQVRGSIL